MLVGKEKVHVPSQVLDLIFKHRQRVFNKHRFSPESRLYPLLLVCKKWHDIAESRLYVSVSLGDEKTVLDEDGDEVELDGEEVCDMFYETVRANPRLASLVRELRLGTMHHARKETERHIALLKICKNVDHVEFSGYNGYALDKLRDTLVTKADLVSLTVSRYGLTDKEGDYFCSRSDLIMHMLKWPRLEKIYMQNHTLAGYADDDDTLPDPSTVAGRCPALKEITVREDCLTPVHLALLSKMAPTAQHLEIHVRAESIPALQRSIQSWSSSLVHLNLTVRGALTHSLASVCSGLTELRYLNVDSAVIPPSEFVHFTRLEVLMYFATSKDAEDLAHVLQKKNALPSLRRVTCDHIPHNERDAEDLPAGSEDELSPNAVKQLREACKARKIDFCDSFLTEEESSYYADSDRDYAGGVSFGEHDEFSGDEYDDDTEEAVSEDEDEEDDDYSGSDD